MTGFTQGVLYGDSSAGGLDAFLIRFGSQGRELWRRQFGSIGDETGVAITTDEEGSVYLTGQTDGNLGEFTNEGGKDLFVAKDDSLGSQHCSPSGLQLEMILESKFGCTWSPESIESDSD